MTGKIYTESLIEFVRDGPCLWGYDESLRKHYGQFHPKIIFTLVFCNFLGERCPPAKPSIKYCRQNHSCRPATTRAHYITVFPLDRGGATVGTHDRRYRIPMVGRRWIGSIREKYGSNVDVA